MCLRIKINLFLLLFIFSTVSALALTKEIRKNKKGYIKFIPSDEYIKLDLNNGNTIELPKYKKITDPQLFSYFSFGNPLNSTFDYSTQSMEDVFAKRKELKSLSEKLGVQLSNTDYLDFYREAADWLGTRYRMGSMSRNAVDCSGFTNIIYNKVFNKQIPRQSAAIANNLTETLSVDELHPGDLVFFATRGRNYINHVGIYLGEGHFVHASIKGVKVSDLSDGYYKKTFCKAGRIN